MRRRDSSSDADDLGLGDHVSAAADGGAPAQSSSRSSAGQRRRRDEPVGVLLGGVDGGGVGAEPLERAERGVEAPARGVGERGVVERVARGACSSGRAPARWRRSRTRRPRGSSSSADGDRDRDRPPLLGQRVDHAQLEPAPGPDRREQRGDVVARGRRASASRARGRRAIHSRERLRCAHGDAAVVVDADHHHRRVEHVARPVRRGRAWRRGGAPTRCGRDRCACHTASAGRAEAGRSTAGVERRVGEARGEHGPEVVGAVPARVDVVGRADVDVHLDRRGVAHHRAARRPRACRSTPPSRVARLVQHARHGRRGCRCRRRRGRCRRRRARRARPRCRRASPRRRRRGRRAGGPLSSSWPPGSKVIRLPSGSVGEQRPQRGGRARGRRRAATVIHSSSMPTRRAARHLRSRSGRNTCSSTKRWTSATVRVRVGAGIVSGDRSGRRPT